MLDSIRKRQQGLMIVIAAIIIVSFAYFYNQLDLGSPVGQTYAFSIDGRKVRYEEAERVARAAIVVANDLNRRDALQGLGTTDLTGLVQNILILQRQAKELGIEATDDEIMDVVRNAPRFQAAGRYDPKTFETYLSEEVERRGIPAKLFFQSVGDTVLYEKLQAVVTAGLNPTPLEVDLTYQREYEKVTTSVVALNRTDFAADIQITDEAIQAYYDTHEDTLKSPERRQIEYVFLQEPKHPRILRLEQERAKTQAPSPTPEAAPVPAESVEEAAPDPTPSEAESEAPADTEPEAPAGSEDPPESPDSSASCGGQVEEPSEPEPSAIPDAPDESVSPAPAASGDQPTSPDQPAATDPGGLLDFDPLTGEENPSADPGGLLDPEVKLEPTPSEEDLNAKRAQEQKENEDHQRNLREFQVRVGDFADAAISPPEGVDTSTHFRELAAKEGFTLQSPPPFTREDAPAELKSARELLPEIFRRDLDEPTSDPVRGVGGFYVFHLLAVEEPKPLSLEEAREQIRKTLTEEKSDERMRTAAKEHRAALIAAVEAGTDFTAAAASRGLTPREIPEFSASKPPTAEPQSAQIVDAASITPEGHISKPVDVPEGLLLVYVRERIPAPDVSEPAADTPEPASPSVPGQPPAPVETPKQQRERIAGFLETGIIGTRTLAFQAWLEHQRELARIVVPAEATPIRLN